MGATSILANVQTIAKYKILCEKHFIVEHASESLELRKGNFLRQQSVNQSE